MVPAEAVLCSHPLPCAVCPRALPQVLLCGRFPVTPTASGYRGLCGLSPLTPGAAWQSPEGGCAAGDGGPCRPRVARCALFAPGPANAARGSLKRGPARRRALVPESDVALTGKIPLAIEDRFEERAIENSACAIRQVRTPDLASNRARCAGTARAWVGGALLERPAR